MGAKNLDIISMLYCIALLIIPLFTDVYLKLGTMKKIFISVIRMFAQLFMVGMFLKYIFEWNNVFINIGWIIVMLTVATLSIINSTNLNLKRFIVPIFLSVAVPLFILVSYFNFFVVNVNNIFDAKYVIVIGGMLLGNALNGNIIGINNFYTSIRNSESKYLNSINFGANQYQALLPFIKESILSTMNPTLASIATIGLVALPGMMTGQILGGSLPIVAIKYQITIMIAILVMRVFSIICSLLFTYKTAFNNYNMLDRSIFKK